MPGSRKRLSSLTDEGAGISQMYFPSPARRKSVVSWRPATSNPKALFTIGSDASAADSGDGDDDATPTDAAPWPADGIAPGDWYNKFAALMPVPTKLPLPLLLLGSAALP